MSHPNVLYGRKNIVSVWTGEFATPDAADAYFAEEFGRPDGAESSTQWVPSRFQEELGLGYYPPWHLEYVAPDPPRRAVAELLADVTFSETFGPLAIRAADEKGILDAAGLACVFHFDYRLKPGWADQVGPVRFLGAFGFVFRQPKGIATYRQLAERSGLPVGALLIVARLIGECTRGRPEEARSFSASEFADFIRSQEPEVLDLMRAHELATSEAVGRVVFALVDAEQISKSRTDAESDFAGLFDLRR